MSGTWENIWKCWISQRNKTKPPVYWEIRKQVSFHMYRSFGIIHVKRYVRLYLVFVLYYIIFVIDGSSFLKVIDEQNTLHILKYGGQNLDVCVFSYFGRLLLAAVHSADCWFDSRVKWWIHVSSIVTYLCKKFFLLRWNSYKQRSESSTRCCFLSTESKCCTHFENSFLIEKSSCKLVNTLPSDIFNSSAVTHNFNLQLAKTSEWSFLVFFRTTAEFAQVRHHLCLFDHI